VLQQAGSHLFFTQNPLQVLTFLNVFALNNTPILLVFLSVFCVAAIMEAETAPIGAPLMISDESVTAGPPPD